MDIVISTFQSSKCNVLQFTDTASGIDSNDLPYIFEAFFSTKKYSGGTGVGLSFCQHVLPVFGGDIYCKSEKGHYATFLLEFPQSYMVKVARIVNAIQDGFLYNQWCDVLEGKPIKHTILVKTADRSLPLVSVRLHFCFLLLPIVPTIGMPDTLLSYNKNKQ